MRTLQLFFEILIFFLKRGRRECAHRLIKIQLLHLENLVKGENALRFDSVPTEKFADEQVD